MRTEPDAIRSVQRFFAGFLPEPWDVRLTVEAGIEPQRPYALIEQNAPATSTGGKNLQDVTIAYTANLYLPETVTRAAADDAALALREEVFRAVKWGADLRSPTPDRIPLFAYEPRSEVQRVTVRGATSGTWRLQQAASGWTDPLPFDAPEAVVQDGLDEVLPDSTQVVARGVGVFDVIFIGEMAGVDLAPLDLDDDLLVGVAGSVRTMLDGAPAPWRTPHDFLRVESFGQTTVRDADNPALVMVAVDLRCTFARGLPLPFDQMLLQRISATSGSGG